MTGRKILIEEMPNPDYLYVHFNFLLGITVHSANFLRPLRTYGEYWNRLDAEAQRLVIALFAVEGMDCVTVYPHKVAIEKGRLFGFDSTSVKIKRALKDVFGNPEVEIKPLSQDGRHHGFGRFRQLRTK